MKAEGEGVNSEVSSSGGWDELPFATTNLRMSPQQFLWIAYLENSKAEDSNWTDQQLNALHALLVYPVLEREKLNCQTKKIPGRKSVVQKKRKKRKYTHQIGGKRYHNPVWDWENRKIEIEIVKKH